MPHADHEHDQPVVFNLIHDSVIPHAKMISVIETFHFNDAWRSWI